MKLRAIILGCGSSGGVPRIGGEDGRGNWGTCDPNEPKNRRSRCSIVVQRSQEDGSFSGRMTTLLIDCAPELRLQMIENGIGHVDAVAITHDHADQTHGLDDLRAIAINQMARVPVYVSDKTSPVLKQRFAYLFEQIPGSSYPPIVDTLEMPEEGATAEIDGPTGPLPMMPFLQTHGRVMSHGFRFGPLAYSSDLDGLVEESWPMLERLDCWIIDALQMKPHGSHLHLAKALEYLEQVRAKRGVLTNLHVTMDYKTVQDQVPENVTVAHDGLVVEVVK